MAYELKDFGHLTGTEGFSDEQIALHLKLYQGYVENTNKLIEEMNSHAKKGDFSSPSFSELKRRFGWEFNGMRLHEYYFENISKTDKSLDRNSKLNAQIQRDFGPFEKWAEGFKKMGAIRGIGWLVLYYDPQGKRLLNVWINEHDQGHPAGCQPVLVMDLFEHAYMPQHGLKKAEYIDNFFRKIDWDTVSKRFENLV